MFGRNAARGTDKMLTASFVESALERIKRSRRDELKLAKNCPCGHRHCRFSDHESNCSTLLTWLANITVGRVPGIRGGIRGVRINFMTPSLAILDLSPSAGAAYSNGNFATFREGML